MFSVSHAQTCNSIRLSDFGYKENLYKTIDKPSHRGKIAVRYFFSSEIDIYAVFTKVKLVPDDNLYISGNYLFGITFKHKFTFPKWKY